MFRLIRKLLRKRYKTGCEYWIYTKDIHIDPSWRQHDVGENKMQRKISYWRRTGEFQSKVFLDRDFNLLDGYSTFRIAEIYDIPKIPVYFVDKGANEK